MATMIQRIKRMTYRNFDFHCTVSTVRALVRLQERIRLLQNRSLAQPQTSKGKQSSDLNRDCCTALTLLYGAGSVPLTWQHGKATVSPQVDPAVRR